MIEAKDNQHPVGAGMQQALDHALTLEVPFVFASNGDTFIFHDRTGQSPQLETPLALDAFPNPTTLWGQYRARKGMDSAQEALILQPRPLPGHHGPGGAPEALSRILPGLLRSHRH